MHQLHGISLRDNRVLELRSADDLPIDLDHHGSRIQTELAE
jgi:hypothetical protein